MPENLTNNLVNENNLDNIQVQSSNLHSSNQIDENQPLEINNLQDEKHLEQQEIVQDGLDYEPSPEVKRTYLPLRKKMRVWGGVRYPGLFDLDPANDAGWFWFTVSMEFVSLGIAAFLLEERVSASVLFISAVSVFFLDFAFAYFHHKYKATESLIENQKRLFLSEMRIGASATSSYANWLAYLEQNLKDDKNRKYTRYFFGFMIWLLSFIKGGIFFVAVFSSYWFQSAVSDSKAPYLLIIVIIASYFWIAFNHLNFSGYYLASCFNKSRYKDEEKNYKRNQFTESKNIREIQDEYVNFSEFIKRILAEKSNPHLSYFSQKSIDEFEDIIKEGLVEISVKARTHFIKKDTTKDNSYLFRKNGFLTDDQINEMVTPQKSDIAKLAVAMYFHKLQMTSTHLNGETL
jgi:hypothetical protein